MKQLIRAALSALIVALSLIAFSAGAMAAPDDDKDYTPDGLGEIWQAPKIYEGQSPTLYEASHYSSYTLDFVPGGFLDVLDNTTSALLNNWANSLMMGTQATTGGAIQIAYQMSTFGEEENLGLELTQSLGKSSTAINEWFLPSMLAIGALGVFIRLGRSNGQALDQFLSLLVAGVLSVTMATHPQAWVGAINGTRTVGVEVVNTLNFASTEASSIPFQGPTPTFNNADTNTTSMRVTADTIWRTYVVAPWCLAEFGSLDACKDFGYELISRPHSLIGAEGSRYDYITKDLKDALGGEETDAYKYVTGHSGIPRLVITLIAFLSASLFALLIIILALTALSYMILVLMLLHLGPIFLPMIAIPGKVRQWGLRWLELLVIFTVMGVVVLFVQSATLAVTIAAIKLSADMGWIVANAVSLTAALTSFLLLRHLRDIFNIPHSGAQSLFGKIVGSALLLKTFKRAPGTKKPSKPSRSPKDTTKSPSATGSGGAPGHGRLHPAGSPTAGSPNPVPSPKRQAAYKDYPTQQYVDLPSSRRDAKQPGKPSQRRRELDAHPQPKRPMPAPQARGVDALPSRRGHQDPYRPHVGRGRSYSRAGHPHLRQGPPSKPQHRQRSLAPQQRPTRSRASVTGRI